MLWYLVLAFVVISGCLVLALIYAKVEEKRKQRTEDTQTREDWNLNPDCKFDSPTGRRCQRTDFHLDGHYYYNETTQRFEHWNYF